jgi:hypothetical protein
MTAIRHEVPARADYFTPAQDALFCAAIVAIPAAMAALAALIF